MALKGNNTVEAGPTKAFFVRMLTRDIELSDAILDLLDNCIDGILRHRSKLKTAADAEKPYEGYWAKITASPDGFSISDNCGGIERDIAQTSAFRFGRPDSTRDSDLATVGMYGIGMKRAMFKMGTDCKVWSQPASGPYEVRIDDKWLGNDGLWTLLLTPLPKRANLHGTIVSVETLHEHIKRQFDESASTFLSDLRREIASHYSLIMRKGFSVSVNGEPITPSQLTLLCPPKITKSLNGLAPYVFTGKYQNVDVEIVAGFRSALSPELQSHEDDEDEGFRRSREDAGWTIVCNDRVVLYNDKSVQTGWGTGRVPSYHNQFISIAGVATFRSNHSEALPLNTTKRGLDTSTDLYHSVLDYMREGTKLFTSYTNHWKGQEQSTHADFKKLKPTPPQEIPTRVERNAFTTSRKAGRFTNALYYAPTLPRPKKEVTGKRVSFLAENSELLTLSRYFYEMDDVDSGKIGRRCFDEALAAADR